MKRSIKELVHLSILVVFWQKTIKLNPPLIRKGESICLLFAFNKYQQGLG
jgi:hypothetical protein